MQSTNNSVKTEPTFTLIVPIAADKPEYSCKMPYTFSLDKSGTMLCVKAIQGLNLDAFDNIYFTILRKHAEAFDVDKFLHLQFKRFGMVKAKIVILDCPTTTQAETVIETISRENINGAIFIKDADGFFTAEVQPENGVSVFPLEQLELVDPRNKSYVAIDDMQHITNIIEKRIVSNLFNAGGYCFENVEDFVSVYKKHKDLGNVYISHLIYSLLLEGSIFRPFYVEDYQDWGTFDSLRISQNSSFI